MENTSQLTPWGATEKQAWFKEQTIKRSYSDEVIAKLEKLKATCDVVGYGALPIDTARYPLFYVKSRGFDKAKKTVLITGGVHGYETSGVQGALSFMAEKVKDYAQSYNVVCFPCISPWGYETINRWNPSAIDPNRSFRENSPAEECALFLKAISSLGADILVHFDLHETTDTDETVFGPALAKRDGKVYEPSVIPDGFYVVGDTQRPETGFQKAIIDAVRKVTHIAPPDQDGNIIGEKIVSDGVVLYDKRKLFLCGGFSNAAFVTTTEVYPDSPKASDAICIEAQVASITGGLDFVNSKR